VRAGLESQGHYTVTPSQEGGRTHNLHAPHYKADVLTNQIPYHTATFMHAKSKYYRESATWWLIGNALAHGAGGCGSNPGNDLGQDVYADVPLSPSSIIWYRHKLGSKRQVL
jgi:hypothetical protein